MKIFAGKPCLSGAELLGEIQAILVNVGDENFFAACGANGLQSEDADGAGTDDQNGVAGGDVREVDTVDGHGNGFEHGGFGERKIFRKAMQDARGHGDEFGEGSGAAVVAAGDAQDLATVAEVHVTAETARASAAVDRGIEGDAIARSETAYGGTDGGDNAGSFVAHDQRGDTAAGAAVVAVNVAAANAAGGDAD